jgi:hypothetical protein
MKSYNGFSGAQRDRAQNWLRTQWRDGRPRPIKCCACGQDLGVIHAHAEDYSEPFGDQTDEFPMCYRCHIMLHCRFQHPEAWDRYRAAIRSGIRFVPTGAFPAVLAQIRGAEVPFTQHSPPTRFPLDEIHEGKHLPAAGTPPIDASP